MQTVLTSFDPKQAKPFMIDFHDDGRVYEGKGRTFGHAILDLAEKIKNVVHGDADSVLARALNQPAQSDRSSAPGIDRIEHVGKIVWYTPGSDDMFQSSYKLLPAIITRAWDGGRMDITLFTGEGAKHRHSIEYSQIPKPGTWCWPKISK